MRECPVNIEHVDHIVDLRRHLVMVESSFPRRPSRCCATSSASPTRGASRRPSAPRGRRASACACSRPATPSPEILYWVGCAASFDERAQTTARSTAKLLQAAGVDFAILGPAEACNGDPARRMGNEYVFQAYAEQNVETLNEAGVRRIVASCPHCFNTLANEYPDFGGRYEVVHHTELLAELVREGRLSPAARRADDHLPRLLLPGPPQRRARAAARARGGGRRSRSRWTRSGGRTFCCGAGGAHMWMEERAKPINEERVREAAATGADTLAVACPFCTVMLDDGVRARAATCASPTSPRCSRRRSSPRTAAGSWSGAVSRG